MIKRSTVISYILIWSLIFSLFRILIIVNDDRFSLAGENQSVITLVIDNARGTIYDVNMNPITNKTEVYKGSVILNNELTEWLESNYTFDDKNIILDRLKSGKPIVIESNVKPEITGAYFLKCGEYYSDDEIPADHIIGYLNEQRHGVQGIEKAFDEFLKNTEAVKSNYILDARNNVFQGIKPNISGTEYHDYKKGVVLTLNTKIQKICEEVASKFIQKGAVVVQEISTGEIRASVSLPQYSIFSLSDALKDENSPMINRAFSAYNVGSVFKLCIAACALENGYSKDFSYECTGKINVGSTVFNCNNHEGHGNMTMSDAISFSCNTYFINLALQLGAAEIYQMAEKFGFGKKTEFCNNMSTASGNLPKLYELQKSIGELVNLSFGQGKLLATPVQINSMITTIANGGICQVPSLVRGTVDSRLEYISKNKISQNRIIKQETAELLKKMMINTVESGTGKNAQITCGAGGKTASAETGWIKNGKTLTQCWFSGFFPKINAKYSITVLVEDGISGSASAAPVFAEIADKIMALETIG